MKKKKWIITALILLVFCIALGVEKEHVRVVIPLPREMERITETIREEIEYNGVSVIIPRRECMQTLARKKRVEQSKRNEEATK